MLDAINAETGRHLTVGHGPRRNGDPPILVADARRAATELGFRPLQSDLKTIIATAWAWHSRVHPKRPVRPSVAVRVDNETDVV